MLKKNKILNRVLLIFGILVFAGILVNNVSAAEVNKVRFKGIGRYAFATAGNNNVYRGDSAESPAATRYIIEPEHNAVLPDNWDEIESQIVADGYEINNLSGSRLDLSGETKYAEINFFNSRSNCGYGDTVEERLASTNEIYLILIHENGDYMVAQDMHADATQFIREHGSGWYFASYWRPLIQNRCVQASWALTVVYEDESLENSYVELINPHMVFNIGTEDQYDSYFETGLINTGETQLIGVYIGAGRVAWPSYTENYNTRDHTYALLSDGSTKQLYETTYKGRTIFEGRTAEEFANGVFNTVRSHNIPGGEVDIFDETLGSDFFDGKEIVGYRVEKEQPALYLEPVLFGLRRTIEAPELMVEPTIPTENPEEPVIVIRNDSDYNACGVAMTLPLDGIGTVTGVSIEPSNGATYEITNNKLIVRFSGIMRAGTDITINLTTDKQTGEMPWIAPVVTYYPSFGETCPVEITGNRSFEISTTDEDLIYRVIAEYVNEDGEKIAEPEYIYTRNGDEYETNEKEIDGYSLKEKPENYKGRVDGKAVRVVYVYESDVAVPNTGGILGGDSKNGAVMLYTVFGLGVVGILTVSVVFYKKRSKKITFSVQ